MLVRKQSKPGSGLGRSLVKELPGLFTQADSGFFNSCEWVVRRPRRRWGLLPVGTQRTVTEPAAAAAAAPVISVQNNMPLWDTWGWPALGLGVF